MKNGFICLHRKLLSSPIWKNSTPEQCKILITLLLMANYKPNKWEWQGEIFECQPGQFITSLDKLVEVCGKEISLQKVRTAIKRFEKFGFLTNESTKTGRLITIVNWQQYQTQEDETNKEDNKDLTNNQQRPNKELTPNEQSNKITKKQGNKKIKEKINKKENPKTLFAEFVSLTNDEHLSLVAKYGEQGTKKMIEILDNYKGSTGKKYASDYRAILSWVVDKHEAQSKKPVVIYSNDKSHSGSSLLDGDNLEQLLAEVNNG